VNFPFASDTLIYEFYANGEGFVRKLNSKRLLDVMVVWRICLGLFCKKWLNNNR